MSTPPSFDAEKLLEVHRCRDDWEATILLGVLRDHQIAAMLRNPPALPPFDSAERLTGNPSVGGIFVLEHDAERARQHIREFLAAATDESLLAEQAARKLRVDKETIHRLRGELAEEKRTFEFLGWVVVVFLGATALLWAIWPAWLKTAPPTGLIRWAMVLLFALCAVFIGSWTNRRLR
jgi:hypothetical protein